MPKTFELRFSKISENLYSGSLMVEGQQMAFGVPKTKDEIYQFLFSPTVHAHATDTERAAPDNLPAIRTLGTWHYVAARQEQSSDASGQSN